MDRADVTVVCCYNDPKQYRKLTENLARQHYNYTLIGIDNCGKQYSSCAKALNAADQISGVYNDLGKAKFYNEDDVYGTYRKFANARTQLADRAAALTDSRTYAANRANGVGTSTVQQEAQTENARKYMADLANIDSQAYSDALSYVSNLSKLQTDQRNAAIAEAVNALSPTISTSTNDATNQLRNSQNEIGALWYGDKAADLERGWLANTYGIGLQNQGNILNALVGLNSNNVNAATNLASGFATSRMEGWYSNGTQVVFACGGGIYTSAVEAALKNNGYVIGVDVDQNYIGANGVADGTYAYNPFITSAMKGLSEAVNTALADIEAGSWGDIAASNGNFGLEDGDYVGLPTDADSWNFESFTTDEYEEVKGKIKSGEITVDNSSDDATKPTVSEFTTVNYIQ